MYLRIGFLKKGRNLKPYDIFARFMTMLETAGLSKGCWNPKRKLGVTTHFSDVIQLKFEK